MFLEEESRPKKKWSRRPMSWKYWLEKESDGVSEKTRRTESVAVTREGYDCQWPETQQAGDRAGSP